VALGHLGERLTKEHIDALARRLEDKDWSVRQVAYCAMEHLGGALADIASSLKRTDIYVRLAALDKLGERLPPALIPALARRLQDDDANVRRAAAAALQNLAQRHPCLWTLKAPAPPTQPP
jgi:HEAT repeat protein